MSYVVTAEYERWGGPDDPDTVEAYSFEYRPEALAAAIDHKRRGAAYVYLIDEDTGTAVQVLSYDGGEA